MIDHKLLNNWTGNIHLEINTPGPRLTGLTEFLEAKSSTLKMEEPLRSSCCPQREFRFPFTTGRTVSQTYWIPPVMKLSPKQPWELQSTFLFLSWELYPRSCQLLTPGLLGSGTYRTDSSSSDPSNVWRHLSHPLGNTLVSQTHL